MNRRGGSFSMRFRRHYTVAQARMLLPRVGQWLHELRVLRQAMPRMEERLAELRHEFGDQGGARVDEWVLAVVRVARVEWEFRRRDILVEDLERGLVGFPSIMAGREVLLSWEEGDEDVGYWKELA